ncbi:MAG: hypothetical protein C4548_11555 [Desulfobacteraceae bacterium]|jgi:ABC-type antimicrobial peptide transport system permease subunit|nr:MAG: hypothetical protein C4548_11555 [Desulfobacteraceae bacterium]
MDFKKIYYQPIVWWSCQVGLILIAGFFLVFGIQLCIQAYSLDDPYFFILTFFSSNLIILVSVVILIGLVLNMISVYRILNKDEKNNT